MSEETKEQVQVTEEVKNEEAHASEETTDWKAEARKWQKRAQDNYAAVDELAKLKEAQMTEQEKLVKRAEDAEAALRSANAQIQHAKDVQEVSSKTGVPAELLEFCSDREHMEQFAENYKANLPEKAHSAPKASSMHLVRETDTPAAKNRDVFAEMMQQRFNS